MPYLNRRLTQKETDIGLFSQGFIYSSSNDLLESCSNSNDLVSFSKPIFLSFDLLDLWLLDFLLLEVLVDLVPQFRRLLFLFFFILITH